MTERTNKSDWKHFKVVRERALERLCQRALDELVRIASDSSATHHERYLEVYDKIKKYDKQIARGFNEFSRSRMLGQIVYARSLDLIDDDDMAGFTQEMQDDVAAFLRL